MTVHVIANQSPIKDYAVMNNPKRNANDIYEHTDNLLSHARWVAERYERMNEQLLTLSSTFLGFLAIEIALLTQIDKNTINEKSILAVLGLATLALLVGSACAFFLALVSISFKVPTLEDFQFALKLTKEEKYLEPAKLMFSSNKSIPNIQESFERENAYLNKLYVPGLWLGFMGQLSLGILIYTIWIM